MDKIESLLFRARREEFSECEKILKELSHEELLEAINYRTGVQDTLLLHFVYENNLVMTGMLIKYGWDANAYKEAGNKESCLIRAAINKNTDMIKLLLDNGANPNYAKIKNNKKIGSNALMHAMERDNLDAVNLLIGLTDLSYKNDLKQSVFLYACVSVSDKNTNNKNKEKLTILSKYPYFGDESCDIAGNNYLLVLAKQNDLSLLTHCVVQLGLYSPNLLKTLDGNYNKILPETLSHINYLYEKYAFNQNLENSLTKEGENKKGFKL